MEEATTDLLKQEIISSVNSKKNCILKHPFHYILKAMVASLIILLGLMCYNGLIHHLSGINKNIGILLACAFFPFCLLLIYYTKSELLTSNMMFVSFAKLLHKINFKDMILILFYCLVGNLLGGLVFGLLVANTSILDNIYQTIIPAIVNKQGYIKDFNIIDCLFRAILCGICINLPLIAIYQTKIMDGISKYFLMFFGVFIFAFLGFEHSIANSILFEMTWLYELIHHIANPSVDYHAILNIIVVIIGNMIGGFLIAFIYKNLVNH